jgi:hypothetical protein
MNEPVELKERVLAAVRRTPSPVRSEARRQARVVVGLGLVVAVGLFFVAGGPRHAAGRSTWVLAVSVASWAAVGSGALAAAWRGGVTFAAGSFASLASVVVGAPALLLVAAVVLAQMAPEVAFVHPERIGLRCFVLTLVAALGPLVGLSGARRSSDPLHPIASGAALGVACAACAGVMVTLWCPVASPRHVLTGHILPMGVLAGVGALLGARVIAMRSGSHSSA